MDSSSRPSAPRLACQALPSERFILTGVHLFDPQHGLDVEGDVLVEDGKIAALGTGTKKPAGVECLDDYRGCWVFPGFVDPHAHLRTPGF
jgi:dihydroorotase